MRLKEKIEREQKNKKVKEAILYVACLVLNVKVHRFIRVVWPLGGWLYTVITLLLLAWGLKNNSINLSKAVFYMVILQLYIIAFYWTLVGDYLFNFFT